MEQPTDGDEEEESPSVGDVTVSGTWRTARAGVLALGGLMLLFGIVGFWGGGQSVAATVGAPPPPPPVALAFAPPGTHPIWPAAGTVPYPGFRTATDVARDFAARALGISDPTVDEPPSVNGSGIGTVTIALPPGGRALAVLTQRQVGGSWVIIQVGDQSRLEGITMLPGGKPGPVMTIHPPAGATSADVTEVAADGTYAIHLTASDLRAGVAHLVARENLSVLLGAPIHTVLIVYRDSRNSAVDALGGEFG
jgi:hypothetical protein